MQQPQDLEKLRALAQSAPGKALIDSLQRSGGRELEDAVAQAAQGDYGSAKQVLSRLLSTSEARALLKQLEDLK